VVQHAFGTVLWVVCALSAIGAFAALISGARTWKDYGKGGLTMDTDQSRGPAAGSAAANRERDVEIREMLEARNARRARRGEPPIDIEQELARLTAPMVDPELRNEIRDLVIARNHRRARLGKPPLDVEAEIEREIAGLTDL
jgi:hypothetical protein